MSLFQNSEFFSYLIACPRCAGVQVFKPFFDSVTLKHKPSEIRPGGIV